jgi:hypothetical protein
VSKNVIPHCGEIALVREVGGTLQQHGSIAEPLAELEKRVLAGAGIREIDTEIIKGA